MSNDDQPDLTRDALVVAMEDLLRVADRLRLTEVAIKLNEAVVALGSDGVVPSVGDNWALHALELLYGQDIAPTRH